MLLEHFIKYIVDTRGISQSSAKHYVQALKTINNLLGSYDIGICNLFALTSVSELDQVNSFLETNNEFQEKDATGHRMYSVAFKHYRRFLCWYNQIG